MSRFEGKTVIVTGVSSGIGAATARRFSAEEANLVLVARSEGQLSKVHPADVGEEATTSRMVEAALQRFGRLDVLVNNAPGHQRSG